MQIVQAAVPPGGGGNPPVPPLGGAPAPGAHPQPYAAQHPGAPGGLQPQHPGAPAGQPHPGAPAGQPQPSHPGAPAQQPPHPGPPSAGQSQHPGPAWGSGMPRDTTGHIPLPPGGPVAVPAPAPVELGTGSATLAVLLIGPAGAGKTTVARHWARSRRVPTAHISLDDVREWVCSGFADPQAGWNEHSEAQYRLARRTCGFAARNFLANGISCILDDAVFPDRPVVGLGGWKRHVGPGLLPVVLLPGLEIVLERNAERSGNRRLSDEEVASIHGRMAGWYGSGLPIIDNSKYDVETTARVLDDVLARSIASPPSW
ncbi:AAA family ATPase [Streptomyces solicathayae]|uniref:AAA family ATPase n=1 Tax=Streptomyces solicathayae TaxID=3081768 RepID=A0ABZ0M4X3_9ACTN|nr:AAA family ATPase [Streptomyces sp. HUAS YS2]WOX26812.1 AAA family ATPase [Streptomyces sp. HUAS YS2]